MKEKNKKLKQKTYTNNWKRLTVNKKEKERKIDLHLNLQVRQQLEKRIIN